VKLRPVEPDELPAQLRESPDLSVEVDAMPGGFVCSASMKTKVDSALINQVALGRTRTRKLLSKSQRAFFAQHAPESLDVDSLAVLGPIFVLKQTMQPKGLGRRVVAELWLYPDNSRILELSTKCTAGDAAQVAVGSRLFLSERGVNLDGKQETKTKAALTYFSKQLRAAAVAT
jgi:hypothetical protein